MNYFCWGTSELIEELEVRDERLKQWESSLFFAVQKGDMEGVKEVHKLMFEAMQTIS